MDRRQFFGDSAAQPAPPPASATFAPMPALPDVEQTLISNTVRHLLQEAVRDGIRELHIETRPGDDPSELRFQVTGIIKIPSK